MKRIITSIAAALLLAPALAHADPKTPDEWYTEGSKQYDLGNFEKAIDAFKKGFELERNHTKKPLEPDKRKEIEDRINELDACAKQQEALRQKPPDTNPDQKPDVTKPDD